MATTLNRSRGGQYIAHVKMPPGNPYDGDTLKLVLPDIEAQIGTNLSRIVADRLQRPQCAADHKFRGYIPAKNAVAPA